MIWTQKLRQKLFGKHLLWLAQRGLTADHLTAASLLSGLAFCPLWFYSRLLALVFLGLHVVWDGLDGPLARLTGTASRRGSFTDTTADQVVVAATTITLMVPPENLISLLPGSIYLFVYTVVIAFAMVRNALDIPYSWIIRPRLIVYSWIVLEMCGLRGTMDYVVWICNVGLSFKLLTGFLQIRAKL